MKGILNCVVFVAACIVADLGRSEATNSSMNLTADPLVFQPALTRKLTIRCSVLNTSVTPALKDNPGGKNEILNLKKISPTSVQDDVTNLLSIVITKVNNGTGKNEVVARVAGCLAADVEVNVLGQLEIEGNTEGSPVAGEAGYLQLTWDRPLENSAGVYTCEVSALNSNKHSISLNTTVRVQAEQPSISYLSMYISQHDRHIESLTKRTVELEHENQNLNTQLQLFQSNVSADSLETKTRLESLEENRIQTGESNCSSQEIRFESPYQTIPTVIASLTSFRISNAQNYYLNSFVSVNVTEVKMTGFYAKCTFGDYISATFTWLAIP